MFGYPSGWPLRFPIEPPPRGGIQGHFSVSIVIGTRYPWFKRKRTGNHSFSHSIWGFPVTFPLWEWSHHKHQFCDRNCSICLRWRDNLIAEHRGTMAEIDAWTDSTLYPHWICCLLCYQRPLNPSNDKTHQNWIPRLRWGDPHKYLLLVCMCSDQLKPTKVPKATGLMQSNNPYDKFFLQGIATIWWLDWFRFNLFFPPGLLVQFLPSIVTLTRHPTFFENYKSHDACLRPSSPLAFKTERLFMLVSDISKYPM
jgi:hypothetical protein